MRDEAYFHLNGTVNKQNFRNWSAAIPHELHQTPLYDPKVTIWCAVWSRGVVGSYFFEDEDGQAITDTSQRYPEMINEFLSLKLPPIHNLWFQQNGATAHSTVISMAALRLLFPQWVISRDGLVPWPPRLPDRTAPDISLWGYLKSTHQTPCRLKCTQTSLFFPVISNQSTWVLYELMCWLSLLVRSPPTRRSLSLIHSTVD